MATNSEQVTFTSVHRVTRSMSMESPKQQPLIQLAKESSSKRKNQEENATSEPLTKKQKHKKKVELERKAQKERKELKELCKMQVPNQSARPAIKLKVVKYFKRIGHSNPCLSMSELRSFVYHVLLAASRPPPPPWIKVTNVDKIEKVVIVYVAQLGNKCNDHKVFRRMKELLPRNADVKSGEDAADTACDDAFFRIPMEKTQLYKYSPKTAVPRTHFLMTQRDLDMNTFPKPDSTNLSKTDIVFIPSAVPATDQSPMFAIDCEMCVTSAGYELTRISIVNELSEAVYDTLVLPDRPILDYKTKYSGITREKLKYVTTKLSDVQAKLLEIFPPDSILIGHSLEFDFKALKFCHRNVIDTSDIYPHKEIKKGLKNSLRYLAAVHLKSKIQTGNEGHCSIEDARTCMDLVKLKIKNGPPCASKQPLQQYESVFKIFEEGIHSIKASVIDRGDVAKMRSWGCVNAVPCVNDEEVVVNTVDEVQTSTFVWSQLRAVEKYFKELKQGDNPEKRCLTYLSETKVKEQINSNIIKIYNSLPPCTMFMVIFGGRKMDHVTRLPPGSSEAPVKEEEPLEMIQNGSCYFQMSRFWSKNTEMECS